MTLEGLHGPDDTTAIETENWKPAYENTQFLQN